MRQTSINRRYGKEEFASRGDAIYENEIRPQLEPNNYGKFAAVDIESGLFEVDADELKACDRLRARAPESQIWLVKIGSPYLHRFGGRDAREMQ